ncbi:MAG: hypothetical protein RL398_2261 [Planctomycetota bacterium]|jgi:hypothetical protein
MTTAGLISMVLSLIFVVGLVSWCYFRVLSAPTPPPEEPEHFHSA